MPKTKTPSDKPWLAYIVSDDYTGESVIVYAQHRATAQGDGACCLNQGFSDVRCHRAGQYDALYPQGPTDEDKFDDGWWFPCTYCDSNVYKDCGGWHDKGGGFYCETCVKGFSEMRTIRVPKFVRQFEGDNPYLYRKGPEVGYPLRPNSNESPYFWYDPCLT